jgi:Na+/H+-dicarboxylate symporter
LIFLHKNDELTIEESTSVMVALMAGVVMSGIPGGGFIGELLIVSLYGFPAAALPMLSVLGLLVDPPATMVNSTGDTLASMLVTRWSEGPDWMKPEP